MALEFLSDEWFVEAKKIADEIGANAEDQSDLTLNIVVTGGPSGDKEAHLKAGQFDKGLVDDAPTKLTVPFEVAKKTFLEGDQQAGMQAFMQGQIKVEGDMSKLMAMNAQAPSASQQEFTKRIKEVTA
jgi:hypothetical protein